MMARIKCACGCGNLIPKVDNRGRLRTYDRGHTINVTNKFHKGDKHYNWKGRIFNDKGNGYIWIKTPVKELNTYHGKYCRRCNWIWYKQTGEIVKKPYLLHHINGNKHDDRYENLLKTTRAKHIQLHKNKRGMVVSNPNEL